MRKLNAMNMHELNIFITKFIVNESILLFIIE